MELLDQLINILNNVFLKIIIHYIQTIRTSINSISSYDIMIKYFTYRTKCLISIDKICFWFISRLDLHLYTTIIYCNICINIYTYTYIYMYIKLWSFVKNEICKIMTHNWKMIPSKRSEMHAYNSWKFSDFFIYTYIILFQNLIHKFIYIYI